jgi:hypothetical protein
MGPGPRSRSRNDQRFAAGARENSIESRAHAVSRLGSVIPSVGVEKSLEMGSHGVPGDPKRSRDLTVGVTLADKVEDLDLPWSEPWALID